MVATTTWLTVMEYLSQMTTDMFYLSQALPGPFLIQNLKHRVPNSINMTCATSGAGTAYPSGAPEFTTGFQCGSCYSIFSFMCMFCRLLFVLFLLAIVLSVLHRFMDSDYPFGIFKLFLQTKSKLLIIKKRLCKSNNIVQHDQQLCY